MKQLPVATRFSRTASTVSLEVVHALEAKETVTMSRSSDNVRDRVARSSATRLKFSSRNARQRGCLVVGHGPSAARRLKENQSRWSREECAAFKATFQLDCSLTQLVNAGARRTTFYVTRGG